MLKLFVVCLVVAVVVADLDTQWLTFKAKYDKKYSSDQDFIRKHIWKNNKKYMEEHNTVYSQGRSSHYMGENEFSDMTREEFVAKMNGLKLNKDYTQPSSLLFNKTKDLPEDVDWRTQGCVTSVKRQGECGSDWAFSATGSIEGQYCGATGRLVSVSESNLVDCSHKFGNQGCNGGSMDNAFKYVIDNHGIDTEAGYPYQPSVRACHFSVGNVGVTFSNYVKLPSGDESSLQKAVALTGPVSCAMDASGLHHYKGGIYNPTNCSSTKLDHAVLVVGYGTEASQEYWLIKFSFGTSWGTDGYLKLIRNDHNKCGIATAAVYPTSFT